MKNCEKLTLKFTDKYRNTISTYNISR